jgi:hypothetical protein
VLPPQTRADPIARRDLSLLFERGLHTKGTVALTRAEARELAGLAARRPDSMCPCQEP